MNNSELRERIDAIQESIDTIEQEMNKRWPNYRIPRAEEHLYMNMVEQSNKFSNYKDEYVEQLTTNMYEQAEQKRKEAERLLSEAEAIEDDAQSIRDYHCLD